MTPSEIYDAVYCQTIAAIIGAAVVNHAHARDGKIVSASDLPIAEVIAVAKAVATAASEATP